MDQLIIKDLELFGFHGVAQSEKEIGQKFVVDAIINLDLSKAGASDSIHDAIHYGNLCLELQKIFRDEVFDLIERAATVLCEYILLSYPQVTEVDLTLKKPWAPIHMPIKYPAVRLIRSWHHAYIAIGSNMGDRLKTIETAMDMIQDSKQTFIMKKSTLIETAPFGNEDQGPFINGVFKVSTLLSPENLMSFLLQIELDLHRERIVKWGPRTIDLDIIYFDHIITDTDHITIPHPRMAERRFVLEPLNEIAPHFVHPLLKLRTSELLKKLD